MVHIDVELPSLNQPVVNRTFGGIVGRDPPVDRT